MEDLTIYTGSIASISGSETWLVAFNSKASLCEIVTLKSPLLRNRNIADAVALLLGMNKYPKAITWKTGNPALIHIWEYCQEETLRSCRFTSGYKFCLEQVGQRKLNRIELAEGNKTVIQLLHLACENKLEGSFFVEILENLPELKLRLTPRDLDAEHQRACHPISDLAAALAEGDLNAIDLLIKRMNQIKALPLEGDLSTIDLLIEKVNQIKVFVRAQQENLDGGRQGKQALDAQKAELKMVVRELRRFLMLESESIKKFEMMTDSLNRLLTLRKELSGELDNLADSLAARLSISEAELVKDLAEHQWNCFRREVEILFLEILLLIPQVKELLRYSI